MTERCFVQIRVVRVAVVRGVVAEAAVDAGLRATTMTRSR
jgi:hypothetical protein